MPVSYRIPQFQRAYAWRLDSQWKPLWNDIVISAGRALSDNLIRPHFMGAIVLQRLLNNTGEVEKRLVVDGQQRLTTLQLLIKAAEAVFVSDDDIARADRLSQLTVNDGSHLGNDNDNDTKIRQSNRNAQTAFQEVIRDSNSGRLSPICEAFNFFKGEITEWLNEDEEPHVIFETLNERSEPLTQSDRIKNTVMYKAKVVDDTTAARELWGMFEDGWWRNKTKEGRLVRTQNDRFLNYWVVTKKPEQVSSDEVAAKFRALLDGPSARYANLDIQDVAKGIRESGQFYRNMEEGRIPEMDSFLRRIKILEMGTVYPILMWLEASNTPWETRARCHAALESYFVRRTLCGLGTMGVNRFFEELLKALDAEGTGMADATLIEQLKKQTVDGRVWPRDQMLKDALTNQPLKGSVGRQKMVLEAIELSLRSDKAEHLIDTTNLTLEHIMPQRWERNWFLPAPTENNPNPQETRNNAVKKSAISH